MLSFCSHQRFTLYKYYETDSKTTVAMFLISKIKVPTWSVGLCDYLLTIPLFL